MRKVFHVTVQAYDLTTGEIVEADRYLYGRALEPQVWSQTMHAAQRAGKRIAYSNEWHGTQCYLRQRHPDQEVRLIDIAAWTGTVLDYTDETVKEGVTLNEDGTIANATIVLDKKDKIVLPVSSAYVKDLKDIYMPLVSYLYGLKDPKRELPDYTYLWINPHGFKPVVRGGWALPSVESARGGVFADYDPADRRFAAWLVDDELPKNSITPEAYKVLEEQLQTQIIETQQQLSDAVVLAN